MAATDHLNGEQFPRISVDRLMRMPSVDAIFDHGGETFADVLPEKTREVSTQSEWQQHGETWDEHGQQQPVHVFVAGEKAYGKRIPEKFQGKMMLGNGHHRVALAHSRGEKSVMFTDNQRESGD